MYNNISPLKYKYKIFVAATKPIARVKKQNWFYFVLSRLPFPEQSRKKKSFEFLFCYRFDSTNEKHYTKYRRKYCTGMVLRNQH